MRYLFETNDVLNAPYEGFVFDTSRNCFPIKSHWHYFMEMIYMEKGTALIECDKKSYIVNPEDLILLLPKTVHSIYATTNENLIYSVIKFELGRISSHSSYAPNLQSIFATVHNEKNATIFFPSGSLMSLPLKQLFTEIIHEISEKDYGYDILIQSKLWIIFTAILRYWRGHGFDTDNAALSAHPVTDEDSIHTITQYIDQHSHESLKVEDLARRCHMSYSYFAKNFQQLYGQSCKQYIEFIRVCKVEDYLLFTGFDLNYISQETGFSDCSHLIKIFKKIKGVTPKQFRQKHVKMKGQAMGRVK